MTTAWHPARWANMDDAALIAGVASAEEGAFVEVYDRHRAALHALAAHMLRARHLAEDVVHDVLVQLWDRPTGFDAGRGRLGAYLRVQLRSRCIDIIRAEASRAAREGLTDAQTTVPGVAPDLIIEQQETVGELRDALAVLRQEERGAIELAYLRGLTYVEVARVLDLPLGTVKARIRRGLERLRRLPTLCGPEST